jgi:hypothetical protein
LRLLFGLDENVCKVPILDTLDIIKRYSKVLLKSQIYKPSITYHSPPRSAYGGSRIK